MSTIQTNKITRTITLPLVKSHDSYGERWLSPDCIRLRGSFCHNRHSPFQAVVFESHEEVKRWFGVGTDGPHCEHSVPTGMVGELDAQPTVIAAVYGPSDYRLDVNVSVGDRLRTYLGVLEIRDDWPLHDPYLVWVSPK